MPSRRYNLSVRNVGALGVLALLATTTACGQSDPNPLLQLTIAQGQQFAHPVRLSPAFHRTSEDTRKILPFDFTFDHYVFRLSAASDEVLLVRACRYENPSRAAYGEIEICSQNAFAIDTEHSYAMRDAALSEWTQAKPIKGFGELRDPHRGDLREAMKKTPTLLAQPIGVGIDVRGYKLRGKEYVRRAEWLTALGIADSVDGKLIVLNGYDQNLLSHGQIHLDVFDSDPARQIATIDAYSPTNVDDRLMRMSIVNSRWLVVGLDLNLQDLVIFDFKPSGESGK